MGSVVPGKESILENGEDMYPSRGDGTTGIIERVEPVVYPGEMRDSGPLDQQSLLKYEETGFLFLESFFDEREVKVMRRELDSLRTNEKVRQSEIAVTEALSGEIRSIFAVQTVSEVFEALVADKRLMGMVQQILGSEVYLHQTRVNYKPGFRGKEFYWHSDFETLALRGWPAGDARGQLFCIAYA